MASRAVASAAGIAAAPLSVMRLSLLGQAAGRGVGRRYKAAAAPIALANLASGASTTSNAVGTSCARGRSSVVAASSCLRRGFASAAGSAEFDKQLMPEDILHLRATSMTIMQDPICEMRPEEVRNYVLERSDPIAELPLWHPKRIGSKVTNPYREQKLAVSRLQDLIIERLDNEALCSAFDIDHGFNQQVYFMIVHAWLLHQRFILEGSKAKKLDEMLFESCWTLVRNWLFLKKVPEYRFDAELMHVQEYMLGCCIHLDKALERPDILPARLQQVLWANVYSGQVKRDANTLTRLTKYCLRQLGLMLQLDTEHFLAGNFMWAEFPLDDAPARRLELPLWKQEFGKARRDM